ncbi:MAG: Multidrug resistance protein [Verrucomicrobiales bacterium]|nr:Multidrug resistance protein [Verrucomicrobiales bacterium]
MSTTNELNKENEKVLKAMAAAAFLVFFSGYMVAPLIPALSHEFSATERQIGWIVPAYMLPYGFSTLFYGPLSDRFGRKTVLLVLLALAIFTTSLISLAWSAQSLIVMRMIAGFSAGGIVTVGLAVVGDLYPYGKLGRAMGWMFGAIAGGMAFGATFGAWLNPYLGWRKEFMILAAVNAVIFILLFKHRHLLSGSSQTHPIKVNDVARAYVSLLKTSRGSKAYSFIFLNGLFHGGVFSWLGFYLSQRYHLSDEGIGKALLGYGIPGMILGPILGRLADRFGRGLIIPLGFFVAAACAFLLVPVSPLWMVTIVVTSLSIGLDMTHPLMAGIVAALDPKRRGQAMGLNGFALFTGLGFGAVIFQFLLAKGFPFTLTVFGATQLGLGLLAFKAFQFERVATPSNKPDRLVMQPER